MIIKGHLNVLYAADNNYAPFMGVSIFSLLENNKNIECITIYAMINEFSEQNIERLDKMVKQYNRELVIINASDLDAMLDDLHVPRYRGGHAPNYRLFFERYIRNDVERLLYIDSDSLVVGSLGELLNIDMQGAYFGGVLGAFGGYEYKFKLGLGSDDNYVNSGVILFDVVKWKECICQQMILDHIVNVRAAYYNPDQDLLNVVFKGHIYRLPCEYNFVPFHSAYPYDLYYKFYGSEGYYSKEEIEYGKCNPVILHTFRFLGDFPWNKWNFHPDRKMYDFYLRKSPWKDYRKKIAKKGKAIFWVEKVLFVCLPRSVFLRVFKKMRNIKMIKKIAGEKRKIKKD